MVPRVRLHKKLVSAGAGCKVHFQPPNNLNMSYPCIVYEIDSISDSFSGNDKYASIPVYQVTVIDSNPDSAISENVRSIPNARFSRAFVTENLHHFVYKIANI